MPLMPASWATWLRRASVPLTTSGRAPKRSAANDSARKAAPVVDCGTPTCAASSDTKPPSVTRWRHVAQRRGIHLVDGDVQVPVVGVLVHRGHPLVLSIPECLAKPVLDVLDLLAGRLFAFGKADHEVVGLVGLRARVLRLGGENGFNRPTGVLVAAIDGSRPGDFLTLVGGVEDVGAKARPACRVRRLTMLLSDVQHIAGKLLEAGSALRGRDVLGNHAIISGRRSRPVYPATRQADREACEPRFPAPPCRADRPARASTILRAFLGRRPPSPSLR
jgi:hypothetical protein